MYRTPAHNVTIIIWKKKETDKPKMCLERRLERNTSEHLSWLVFAY